ISGTAYVSGPSGQTYGPGSAPLAGVTIDLFDANGKSLGSTVTGSDGSYQFALPGPGRYQVAPAPQAGQVNVPARPQLQIDSSNPTLSLNLTTPGGNPLYGLGYAHADMFKAAVSGDFFGNGKWDFATFGVDPISGSQNLANLYVSIIQGADSRDQITSES